MIHIAICDDSKQERQILAALFKRYQELHATPLQFVVQFMPSICCIFYFVFIFYYYHKLEEQEQAERLAESLHMQLTHAAIDLNHMRTMQTQAASYRHDMRHHFTYLQALAGTGNLDKIQEYIQTAQSDLDAITPKRFCSNELINLLLSAYDTKAESDTSDPDQQSVYRNGFFSKWDACLHTDRTWIRN